MEPSPYSIWNVPLFLDAVEEEDAVKRCFDLQVELVHDELGTQRSDEPVSKSRFRVTPGVPILTGTTYSRLQNKNMRM